MKGKTKALTYGAVIAAMYTVLTLVSFAFGLSSGVIQVRISEALTILPYFTPYAIWGLFAGCLVSNIITGCALWDIIFGSVATLIGAFITYGAGKIQRPFSKYLAPVGPVLSNTIIIPMILTNVYGIKETYPLLCLTVGAGEIISAGFFGTLLLITLKKHSTKLF